MTNLFYYTVVADHPLFGVIFTHGVDLSGVAYCALQNTYVLRHSIDQKYTVRASLIH